MVQSQFSLSWDTYKTSICNGFSSFQQNGEFVDMTIAADGHFVKVHQALVALASPYLKDLIKSAPCQHPVIFLNNVTHRTLCLLLEYIYTGEVAVPAECLASFGEAAKALHIRGLENIKHPSNLQMTSGTMPHFDDSELCHISGGKVSLPASARKIFIKHDDDRPPSRNDMHGDTDLMEDSGAQDSDDGFRMEDLTVRKRKDSVTKENQPSTNLQFTVSIRGSLQVILNRFIYNLQSSASKSGIRRWRCVDYRNNKCTAFVVTKGNVVLNRANLHNHAFHDKKILAKIEKKAVYSAIDEVVGYQEKDDETTDNDMAMEHDSFISLPEFSDTDKPDRQNN